VVDDVKLPESDQW